MHSPQTRTPLLEDLCQQEIPKKNMLNLILQAKFNRNINSRASMANYERPINFSHIYIFKRVLNRLIASAFGYFLMHVLYKFNKTGEMCKNCKTII